MKFSKTPGVRNRNFFLKSSIWTIWKGRNFIDAGGLREVPQSNIFYSAQSKELQIQKIVLQIVTNKI
jgi:hypothetical protein